MTKQDRIEGTGVLFTNKDKKHPKSPDYAGELKMDQDYRKGEVIKISAWTFTTSVGQLINLKINNYKPDKNQQQYPKEVNVDDGDVPF